jgi:myosin-crossreactive antigen
MFIASMKNAAIGLYAFSQAMEHDWNMIKPRCGAHCKTCRARCSAEYLRALEQIVAESASRLAVDSERVSQATRACVTAASEFVAYADEVGKTDSFKEAWKHWRIVAEQVDALAGPLADILSAEEKK